MQYGFVLPGGSAQEQLEQAVLADQSGWDGVFTWEAAYGVDPWTLMGAMAQRTTHVKLGTLLTPLPWRRPWKVASQVVTLDQVSNGRAILAVGLGAVDTGLGRTGEVMDRAQRAQMLDEGIDLMRGLWEGRRVFEGQHYTMDLEPRGDLSEVAQPVQARLPIWVVGVWKYEKSMRRVLRCDGILPATMNREMSPDHIREIRAWLTDHGAREDFDVIAEGETPPSGGAEQIAAWAEAGATWWLETRWEIPGGPAARQQTVADRLRAGPPRA